jgi:hypothetical protein
MLKQIGKEFKKKEEGGMYTADHFSPSQLNKNLDQWFYDYCVLTEKQRKAKLASLKMIFGSIAGRAFQDLITEKLTIDEVMKGRK